MGGTVIAFIVIALAIGAVIGWLLGSRDGAGAKQTLTVRDAQHEYVFTAQ